METISVNFAASWRKTRWAVAYICIIVAVNVLFNSGGPWPLVANVLVGLGFIVRDLAQRDLGDRVLLAMAGGLVASAVLADAAVVGPSIVAFGCAEIVDYLVVRRLSACPMWQRMIASHIASVPLDTALFLSGLALTGVVPWGWAGFWRMNAFKAAALAVVVLRRER